MIETLELVADGDYHQVGWPLEWGECTRELHLHSQMECSDESPFLYQMEHPWSILMLQCSRQADGGFEALDGASQCTNPAL